MAGHTNCVEKRFLRHASKIGAHHTTVYAPEQVEHKEEFLSEVDAIQRGLQIKKWSRAKKKAFIERNLSELRTLSKSRDHKNQSLSLS